MAGRAPRARGVSKIDKKKRAEEALFVLIGVVAQVCTAPDLIFSKQLLQYTGLSNLGTKGTEVCAPQAAQMTVVISRWSALSRRRAARQVGQRWGSFKSPFSK
jgi:hypothetical protein